MIPTATPRPPMPDDVARDLPPPVPVPLDSDLEFGAPAPRRPRLDLLAPGKPRAHNAFYSQFVGTLKFALPAAALGIACVVLLRPQVLREQFECARTVRPGKVSFKLASVDAALAAKEVR